ncbi:MAG: glycosyltransferase family 2 protein [Sphingobacteriales bacterium]|nr:MAG: glycosyltransferase family 2 protein [Sphingobacteriales bacterium]
MQYLSVVIITFNEEDHISNCIDSVSSVADEIIVVDCFSTDRTVEIARAKGAIVREETWRGYIEQKNLALSFAKNNYVLSLDADEMLDDRLRNSIAEAKKTFGHKAYIMNRCTSYCGKFIRHGQWYPDRKLRLFDKRVASWGGLNPHDKIVLSSQVQTVHLDGDILHYSYASIEEHVTHGNKFSTIAAESLYARGRKPSWINILANPLWTFIHGYIVRRGMLDGVAGFIIAIISAHHTFLKYIKLYQLWHRSGSSGYKA